jgi:hypothetical protein
MYDMGMSFRCWDGLSGVADVLSCRGFTEACFLGPSLASGRWVWRGGGGGGGAGEDVGRKGTYLPTCLSIAPPIRA